MRIDTATQATIAAAVRCHFGASACVRLFGSRIDDSQRGGDIDLFIDDFEGDAHSALRCRIALAAELKAKLGDQRIDIVVARKQGPPLPIHAIARRQGVELQ